MMDSSKAVRHALAHVNKNKAWLANKLDVTPGYITHLTKEENPTIPSIEMFQRIADVVGVSFSRLALWGEDK